MTHLNVCHAVLLRWRLGLSHLSLPHPSGGYYCLLPETSAGAAGLGIYRWLFHIVQASSQDGNWDFKAVLYGRELEIVLCFWSRVRNHIASLLRHCGILFVRMRALRLTYSITTFKALSKNLWTCVKTTKKRCIIFEYVKQSFISSSNCPLPCKENYYKVHKNWHCWMTLIMYSICKLILSSSEVPIVVKFLIKETFIFFSCC